MQRPQFENNNDPKEIEKRLAERIKNPTYLRCAINKYKWDCEYDEAIEKHWIEAFDEICRPPPPWWADILD